MKKFFLLFTVMLITASCVEIKTTTTEEKRVTEERNIKGFKSIKVEGAPNVHYKQDTAWSVKVIAQKDIIKNVRTEVIDGRLVVSQTPQKSFLIKVGGNTIVDASSDVDVVVSSPDIIGINMLGSGCFIAMGNINTDKLNICLQGSGDIKCSDIICDTIHTQLKGSGDIVVSKVDAFSSDISLIGSGDIKLTQHNVNTTKINLKGSGDIVVNSDNCGSVDCELNGSGDIRLAGDVKSLNRKTNGSGEISFTGEIKK